jgi:hypothetical protein
MKKIITILVAFTLIGMTNRNNAQTYDAVGLNNSGSEWDTVYYAGDTLSFTFTGLPGGYGYGNATIEVTYFGYFGWGNQYFIPVLPGTTTLADIGGSVSSCTNNTNVQTFAASDIDSWGTSAVIKLVANQNMQPTCYFQLNKASVRLTFDYCLGGVPVDFADMDFEERICASYGLQTLTGIPAGGTFSGAYVSGNTFDPAGLPVGNYPITYTYTDTAGCISSKTENIRVMGTPGDVSELICEASEPVFASGGAAYVFSPMPDLSLVFDTAAVFTFPAVTQSPTTYYYARYDLENSYLIDTITNDSSFVVDIDYIAGDDRGGIAITDSAVYMVGDDATIRYDLDLLTPGVELPIRDGIFTDLRERKIYSLYNTNSETMPDNEIDDNFTCNALIALDADLNPTSTVIPLSTTLALGADNTNSIIFAGYGELLIYNGNDEHIYAIDMDFGDVEDLGSFSPNSYSSENWADWGVAGYDGTDYTVYYMSSDLNQIVAHNLTTATVIPVTQFTDVSDLASFVTHPVNHRLYFHYEGGAQFGGGSETLGYIDMTDTAAVTEGGGAGCPAMVIYTFDTINLGNDTTVCGDNNAQVLMLEAGEGYQSYTWNGVNNNWNVFPAQNSGQYILEVVNTINCTLIDTINVTVIEADCSAGLDEFQATKLTAYPVPNKGTFNLVFGKSLSNARITLVNAQGVTCFATAAAGTQQEAAIQASGLAAGVYFVQVTSDEGTVRPITVIVE